MPPPTKGKALVPPGTGARHVDETYGSDLYIRDLASSLPDRTILDVSEYNLSNDEKTLVYAVASKTETKNGVYALRPKFGTGGFLDQERHRQVFGGSPGTKQNKLAFFYDEGPISNPNLARRRTRPVRRSVRPSATTPAAPDVDPTAALTARSCGTAVLTRLRRYSARTHPA